MHDSKSFILTVKVSFQILNIIKALKIDEQIDGLDCAKICKKIVAKVYQRWKLRYPEDSC